MYIVTAVKWVQESKEKWQIFDKVWEEQYFVTDEGSDVVI
jgi:hypothetical protein